MAHSVHPSRDHAMQLLVLAALAAVSSAAAPSATQGFGPEQPLAFPASFVIQVYVGDLDGDGDLDFAYGGHTTAAWFENLGPQGFRRAQVLQQLQATGPTYFGISSITGGDLDADGDLDLVAADAILNRIVWFENRGAGVFEAAQVLASVATAPPGIVCADMDGDSDLDLVYTLPVSQQLRLIRNLGAGNFAAPLLLATLGDNPAVLVAEDFDADGDRDLAIGGSTTIQLLKNQGNGTLGAPIVVESNTQDCRHMTVADLDGDGARDLIWTSTFGEYLAWQRSSGGSLAGKQVLASNLPTASTVAAADLDADGDQDLTVGSYSFTTEGELVRLLNDGTAVFSSAVVDTQLKVVEDLVLADVDADGLPDVLCATRNAGQVALYSNQGAGAFAPRLELTSGLTTPSQVATADIDGDGDLDVLALEQGASEVLWYQNQGAGSFAAGAALQTATGEVREFVVIDVALDGQLDLVLAGTFGLRLHRNLGQGVFGPAITLAGPATNGWGVAAGDLDGDGFEDLVFAYGPIEGTPFAGQNSLGKVLYRGAGIFNPLVKFTNASAAKNIVVGDVVGSDLPELLFSLGYFGLPPVYMENLGQATFSAPVSTISGGSGDSSMALGDADGDGDLDLVGSAFFGVYLYSNLGSGFGAPVKVVNGERSDARLVDLDGDNTADLLTAGENGIAWSRGLGNGAFAAAQSIESNFLNGYHALAADLDGDGGVDVVATEYNAHNLSWYPNRLTADCNQNGTFDSQEIALGQVPDCDGNGVPDGCDLLQPGADVDQDGQLDACVVPPLLASSTQVSVAGGGAVLFDLTGPAGALYLVLGSLSGTAPGTALGPVTVPLNLDAYTLFSIELANQAPFAKTLGTLDASGAAAAVITLPAGSNPGLAGLSLHHAFVTLGAGPGVSFASNPVALQLKP